jgi:uncharacterized protein (DUF302 family)
MKYIVESNKPFEQAVADLEVSAVKNKFGVLHIHDLQTTLRNKGIDFPQPCKILEVCNPQIANEVLQEDISLNMALPCRISVWVENGKTKIGMLSPKTILSLMSDSDALAEVATGVEEIAKRIIDEAV